MSETVKSFIGRVAVVEQEGSAVRVLLNEGETMYAARDLLAACGCAYQDAWMKRSGRGFWILENMAKGWQEMNWVGRHTFKSQQAAVDALNALIRERSKGAHTQTQRCGGFGIDIVIDEDTANDMRIVDWKIQKQYKTQWELVDEMEASE